MAFTKLSLLVLMVAQAAGVAEDTRSSAWLAAPPLVSVALAGAGRFRHWTLSETTGSTSPAEEDLLVSDEVWSNGGTRIDVACFVAGSAVELTAGLLWQSMVGDEARVVSSSDVGGSDDAGSATMDCSVRGGLGPAGQPCSMEHPLPPTEQLLFDASFSVPCSGHSGTTTVPQRTTIVAAAALPRVPAVRSLCLHWTVRVGGAEWRQVSSHTLATSWRPPLLRADERLYEEVALLAAAGAETAWPLPRGEGEDSDEAATAVMKALLRALWRSAEGGWLRYGPWKRPVGGLGAGQQVRHLLRRRVGLCGELTALLASLASFHGIASRPLKLCFVDRNARAIPGASPASLLTAKGPAQGIWFLHAKRGSRASDEGRHPALGCPRAYAFDFRDHSFLEVAGRVYDATHVVSSDSWEAYFAHMARVQWEFCRCDGDWGDAGCDGPTACFAIDSKARPEGLTERVLAEGRLPVQLVAYRNAPPAGGNASSTHYDDDRDHRSSRIIFGRYSSHLCHQP
mmetsp:Transcript_8130/g.14629  ORF Transcript_8130/g.14629 Transcript_8130/m.14629 type:complete len:512 (-) Transcript_8130:298-1833(-)